MPAATNRIYLSQVLDILHFYKMCLLIVVFPNNSRFGMKEMHIASLLQIISLIFFCMINKVRSSIRIIRLVTDATGPYRRTVCVKTQQVISDHCFCPSRPTAVEEQAPRKPRVWAVLW
ncbi:hypothetical protein T05_6196 [Trichinella murrelli]|uniref:Uncharacterized protein n=1 Tax=Trichinella murrelli TaxID=144512 RepID=A0A0V0TCM8_9BILA|nr:hypothetical protein T05_6196 [Trichinella murrelli]